MNALNCRFTQISLLGALLCGRYDGVVPVKRVKQCGNMAIATMDRLEGEMMMINGTVYQARTDGRVYRPGDDETIPFGIIADFQTEESRELCSISSFEEYEQLLDNTLYPDTNIPLAVFLTGRFSLMKVRSVDRQEKNGVRLADAADKEIRFEFRHVSGDLIGFRLPGYIKGINAPGWHLHFLDTARKHGGHVLNFSLKEGTLRICHCSSYKVLFPEDPSLLAGLDLDQDFSADLKKAEAER